MKKDYESIYLSGHHFTIDAANIDACIQARLVMGVHYVSAVGLVDSNAAVVWSLQDHGERCD